MSTLPTPRLSLLAALSQCAALSFLVGSLMGPALAQLSPTPVPILPDLRYAVPLDLDGDGRDEIVGVSHGSNALDAYSLDADGIATFDRRLANLGSLETRAYNGWKLQLADVDNDGRDDLVQVDGYGLYIFFDLGGPQFEERVMVQNINSRRSVEPIDLDADGDLDLLSFPSYDSGNRNIAWFENVGGGTFAPAMSLPSGAEDYVHLEPVDIDGDGDLDLVGMHTAGSIPTFVRNLGGTFQIEPIPGAVGYAEEVTAQDIDGDGLLDLLAHRPFLGGSVLDLYRGAPGGFLAPMVILDSPVPLGGELVFANVDGAGGNELICQGYVLDPPQASIVAFEWNSQGTFDGPLARVDFHVGTFINRLIQPADFDGDGKEDLMFRALDPGGPSSSKPFGPRVVLGATDAGAPALEGPFRLMELSPSGFSPPELYFPEDLDGDGVLDLVRSRQGDLQWQQGRAGSVDFSLPARISDAGIIQFVADLDGDGLAEIVLADSSHGSAVSLSLIRSLGAGEFSAPLTIHTALPGSGGVSFRAFDFDADGDFDLFPAPESGRTFWIENLGGLNFAPPTPIAISTSTSTPRVMAGDFDGDGDTDLLGVSYATPFTYELGWYEGLGGGSFGPLQPLVTTPLSGPAIVDVDEDGFDDVVYSDASETYALLGSAGGLGAGGAPVRLFSATFGGPLVHLVDVNADGLTDFVEARSGTSTEQQPVFLRTGPLAFDSSPFAMAPNYVRLYDFGADGDLDGLGSVSDFDWQGRIDVIHEGLGRGIRGTSYCGPAVPNSSGSPASLLALGTSDAQANELRLRVTDAARSSFGFFLVSPQSQPATPVVGSAGRLCLGGSIGRYVSPGQVQSTGATGSFQLSLDLTAIPTPLGPTAALPGATWYFQAWFRDFAPTGPTSNFTDGVEVNFQ